MAPVELTTPAEYEAFLAKYDAVLFDCDGVVWEGDHVFDGVTETLDYLRRKGKQLLFVTNNATKSRAENQKKFIKLGLQADVEEIFSSAYASAVYLKYNLKFPADKKVYVIGEKGIEDELDAVGIKHSGGTAPDDNVFIDLMDFSSITADPEVGAVLIGLDMHINYKKVAKAFRYLRENKDCLLVCTNLDSTFPTHGSIYPGAGAIAAPLLTCSERVPIVVGKPESAMLDSIFAKHGLDPKKTLMVGDRLNTDILFGANGGLDTLLVLTGVHKKADYEKENPVAVPTHVIRGLGDFAVLAGKA